MTDFRSARAGDASQIAALLNPILRDTTISFSNTAKTTSDIAATIQEHAQKNLPYIVAHSSTKIIGVASYAPFRTGNGYARTMEHTIYVSPEHKQTGTGRNLLAALESHARENGITNLIAGISAENTAGIAFHARLGFTLVGHLPAVGHKFERELDLILMQKALVTRSTRGT